MKQLRLKSDCETHQNKEVNVHFNELTSYWWPRIVNYVRKKVGNLEDAQDITQDTFLKALRALQENQKVSNFEAWIYRIAQNSIASYYRKKCYTITSEPEDIFMHQGGQFHGRDPIINHRNDLPFDLASKREESEILHESIDWLADIDSRKAQIVKSRFFEFKKERQIAEEMGLPVGTVKRLTNNAKSDLQFILNQQGVYN